MRPVESFTLTHTHTKLKYGAGFIKVYNLIGSLDQEVLNESYLNADIT